ncbi:FlgK family flagellar hook-associated protein, partial [Staphylococcus aureus]|uniref:FlgK family flagellar hook-associated protein n=1 Tax=Staphylococcus aureus TaxID=1280 RepID=UPI00403C0249
YPPIEIRFASPDAATGDRIDSAAIGGKLGGLLDLRDRALPAFSEQLGTLFTGLPQALNSVSNAGSPVPPPASLTGRNSGTTGSDRLGFTGAAALPVPTPDRTLVPTTQPAVDPPGPKAPTDDLAAAIDPGPAGAAT